MAKTIQRLVPSQAPTLLDAAKGNQLIEAINDLITSRGVGGIEVKTEANGRLVISLADDAGLTKIPVVFCRNGVPVNGFVYGGFEE